MDVEQELKNLVINHVVIQRVSIEYNHLGYWSGKFFDCNNLRFGSVTGSTLLSVIKSLQSRKKFLLSQLGKTHD